MALTGSVTKISWMPHLTTQTKQTAALVLASVEGEVVTVDFNATFQMIDGRAFNHAVCPAKEKLLQNNRLSDGMFDAE